MTVNEKLEINKWIIEYISHLKSYPDTLFNKSLIYFLSQKGDNENDIRERRKLFVLKVLRENTSSGQLQLNEIPKEIEDKLVDTYSQEMKKQEEAKKAHVAELMQEMNELF